MHLPPAPRGLSASWIALVIAVVITALLMTGFIWAIGEGLREVGQ